MRTLYHYPLCPFSRKIRLTLAEKKLDFALELEPMWERRPEFLSLNPLGYVPVLIDLNGTVLCESQAISEYIHEVYPTPPLYPEPLEHRTEARRITAWIDDRFGHEVSLPLLFERALRRYYERGSSPDSRRLRQAKNRIHHYMDHLGWLIDRRRWLAGDQLSIADLTMASHLSIIDYLGDVPWDNHSIVKDWYARIKSRPSFRPLLADTLPGHGPAPHYTDLDF